MKVAFIGVGNMGRPMAANAVKAGHEVMVFDANPEAAAAAASQIGAKALGALRDVAAADLIVTMLPDGHVVSAVALGEGGIASVAPAGTVVIDMSSSQPMVTRQTGAALAARGITLIDAPVSGGVARAASGTLTIMIGGNDPAAIAAAKGFLVCLGNKFFEVGKLGSGHAAKALNNAVAASNYAVLADAMTVGEGFGLDPGMLVDIVNVSTGQSFCSTVVMSQHVLPGTFDTGFAVGLLAKDVNIAVELGDSLAADAPHIRLSGERWAAAREALGAGADHSKAILAWQATVRVRGNTYGK